MDDDRLAHQVGLIGAGADRPTDSISRPQLTPFELSRVDPPSRVFISRNDRLFIAAAGVGVGNDIVVRGRLLETLNGQIMPFEQRFTPSANRTFLTTTLDLAEGFLLSVSAQAFFNQDQTSSPFVVVGLIRPGASGAQTYETLLSGYVTLTVPISWPESPLRSQLDGPFQIRTVVGTTPAAGAEISETVPTNARWKLRSLLAGFTASAAVANRNPVFVFDDGANVFCRTGTDFNVTAGQGRNLQLFHATNRTSVVLVTDAYIPIPAELSLAGGYRIRTATANLQGGDQYTAPVYLVEELLFSG